MLKSTRLFSQHRTFSTSTRWWISTTRSLYRRDSGDTRGGKSGYSAPPISHATNTSIKFHNNSPAANKSLPYFRFIELLELRLKYLQKGSSKFQTILKDLGLFSKSHGLISSFVSLILAQPASSHSSNNPSKDWQPRPDIPTLKALAYAHEEQGIAGLDSLVLSKFNVFASMSLLSAQDLKHLKSVADLRRPADWYPIARSTSRKLILHVGPTNSGKTYHALQRLKQAESGCFAGPLRLLAFEIYERFNKENIPCNLRTGEESRDIPGSQLTSCTIEMLSCSKEIDVLVIDEIQMIGDPDRGTAWTQALLACPAKEIHMCGEASVVDLVTKIAATLGETVEVKRYERLGSLEPMNESLGGTFKDIQEGDAVVSFSRRDIFNIKKSIEQSSGKKCAVVYGGLPPETRAQQANLFNDPDSGFDVMVASDAIGMGLNLSIKRIIFETVSKWNGQELAKVPIPQMKQIAGRAGRFKPKAKVAITDLDPPKEVPGYVTTLRDEDLAYLHDSLATPTVQLDKAYIRPTPEIMEAFTRAYPEQTKLSIILQQFQALATTSDLYAMRDLTKTSDVQDLIAPIKGLRFAERWVLFDAPLKPRDPQCVKTYLEMVQIWASGGRVDILKLKAMDIDLLDEGPPQTQEKLAAIESLHVQLTLYLWLAIRFPGPFPHLDIAYQLKAATEDAIAEGLSLLRAKKSSKRNAPFINAAMEMAARRAPFEHRDRGASRRSPPRNNFRR